jgi:hypothetical protein
MCNIDKAGVITDVHILLLLLLLLFLLSIHLTFSPLCFFLFPKGMQYIEKVVLMKDGIQVIGMTRDPQTKEVRFDEEEQSAALVGSLKPLALNAMVCARSQHTSSPYRKSPSFLLLLHLTTSLAFS